MNSINNGKRSGAKAQKPFGNAKQIKELSEFEKGQDLIYSLDISKDEKRQLSIQKACFPLEKYINSSLRKKDQAWFKAEQEAKRLIKEKTK